MWAHGNDVVGDMWAMYVYLYQLYALDAVRRRKGGRRVQMSIGQGKMTQMELWGLP